MGRHPADELLDLIDPNWYEKRLELEERARAISEGVNLAEMEATRLRMEEARKAGRWSRTGSLMAALGIRGDSRKQREAEMSMATTPHPLALAGETVKGGIRRPKPKLSQKGEVKTKRRRR